MRIAVVPRPTSVIEAPGTFRLTARTPIVICDEQLRRPAEIFVDAIAALTLLADGLIMVMIYRTCFTADDQYRPPEAR